MRPAVNVITSLLHLSAVHLMEYASSARPTGECTWQRISDCCSDKLSCVKHDCTQRLSYRGAGEAPHCLVSTAGGQDILAVRIESQAVDFSVVCFMLLHDPCTAVKQLLHAALDNIHALHPGRCQGEYQGEAQLSCRDGLYQRSLQPFCDTSCLQSSTCMQETTMRGDNDTAQYGRCWGKCNALLLFRCTLEPEGTVDETRCSKSKCSLRLAQRKCDKLSNDHIAIPTSHCYPNNYMTIPKHIIVSISMWPFQQAHAHASKLMASHQVT